MNTYNRCLVRGEGDFPRLSSVTRDDYSSNNIDSPPQADRRVFGSVPLSRFGLCTLPAECLL